MSQASTLQNAIVRLIRGTTWGSRIAFILIVLIFWVWSEGSIVEEIETPSSFDRGNVGNVVKYKCSAKLQDYFKKQASSSSIRCEQAPKTIWVGHFPGSGVEVVRKIVQAITGMNAPSTFFDDGHVLPSPYTNCQDWSPLRVTECPLSANCPLPKHNPNKEVDTSNGPQIQYHKSSILVVRNPLTAIPGRVNIQYEEGLPKDKQHKDSFSPAPQSPVFWWNAKRIKYLQSFLSQWERVMVQWTAGSAPFYPSVDLVIAQERLISPHYGPHLIQLLTDELVDAGSPIRIISPNTTLSHQEIYYCLWELLVDKDYHDPTTIATKIAQDEAQSRTKTKKVRKKKKKKKDGSDDDDDDVVNIGDIYQPGYTKDGLNHVSDMVEHVIHEELATDSKNPQQHIHRTELMHILNDYRRDLEDAISTSYVRIVKK